MVKDKARLRARLTALFPAASALKSERLDVLAAKLKATDESTDEEIDEELTAYNDGGLQTFEQIVKEDNQAANWKSKAESKKTVKVEKIEEEEEEPEPEGANAALLKRLKALEDERDSRNQRDTLEALHAKFKADQRLKDVPATWIKNSLPSTEEEFEDAVLGLEKDFKDFATEHKLENFKGDDTPPAGKAPRGGGGATEQITEEEADDLTKQLLSNAR